jgi:hypothetical protein
MSALCIPFIAMTDLPRFSAGVPDDTDITLSIDGTYFHIGVLSAAFFINQGMPPSINSYPVVNHSADRVFFTSLLLNIDPWIPAAIELSFSVFL